MTKNELNISRRQFLRTALLSSLLALDPLQVRSAFARNSTEKKEGQFNWEKEIERLIRIQQLKVNCSTPYDEINPKIANLHFNGFLIDFFQIPEIQSSLTNKNLQERILQIIKVLSVQSREELLMFEKIIKASKIPEIIKIKKKIEILVSIFPSRESDITSEKFIKKWKEKFPNKQIPSWEQLNAMLDYYNYLIDKIISENKLNYGDTPQQIPSWSNQDSCNLYASSFIECLGLQNKCSHRVDELNQPVIYTTDPLTGKIKLVVEKNGKLISPTGKIRELSAQGQLEWFSNYGEHYGWKEVTNLSYDEKVSMLKEGYIFYGASEAHNWIVFGMEFEGVFQPFLTQATDHNFFSPFLPKELMNKEIENTLYDENKNFYGMTYKLMPQLEQSEAKIFAIKV